MPRPDEGRGRFRAGPWWGQHRALGPTGRTGGVEHGREVKVITLRDVFAWVGAERDVDQACPRLPYPRWQRWGPGRAVNDAVKGTLAIRVTDEQARFGVAQEELNLRWGVGRV